MLVKLRNIHQEYESKRNEIKIIYQNRENVENSPIMKLEREVEDLNEVDAQKKIIEDLRQKLNEKTNLESELEVKKQTILKLQQQIKKIKFAKESYQQQAKSQNQKLLKYETLEHEKRTLQERYDYLKTTKQCVSMECCKRIRQLEQRIGDHIAETHAIHNLIQERLGVTGDQLQAPTSSNTQERH